LQYTDANGVRRLKRGEKRLRKMQAAKQNPAKDYASKIDGHRSLAPTHTIRLYDSTPDV